MPGQFLNNEELTNIMVRLSLMNNRKPDDRGAYLGDGLVSGPDIRSKDLQEALLELIVRRESPDKNWEYDFENKRMNYVGNKK